MYYIGIDIGGTGIKAGVVAENGDIIYKDSIPTEAAADYTVIVKSMAELVNKVIADSGIDMDEVASIGMGCPGSIDDKNGIVTYSNNINFENAPLCEELKKYIDKPVYINNDANCAALGEYFAQNDDNVSDFVAITLGTGVGGGVVINKKLYTGSNGAAGELGHIVICKDGEQCSCGRKGCWEAYSSATALIRDTERAAKANPDSLLAKLVEENGGKANGKIPWDAMQSGDPAGKEVIDNYIENLSEGIANIANIFQPSTIAIGGGVSRQGDNLINPLKEALKGKIYGGDFMKTADIVTAKLGNDAGIIGAAFLGK
ncbi:MAG: ROK family protein [Clostridia bacterium]|nr:ROK family protein [Clostridia bacterium]